MSILCVANMNMLPLFYKPDKHSYRNVEKVSYEQTYPSQDFVLSMLHPSTPYRGMLLTFQLGNGKTYVAAALSHLYNKSGFGVMFLAHNVSTIENFKKEYSGFVEENQVSRIGEDIQCMGITRFLTSKPSIRDKLIIIDEAHNIRESASRYRRLQAMLDLEPTIRILVITATPMIDSVNEISSLRCLIEKNAPVAYSNKVYSTIKSKYIGEKFKIGTLFKSIMRGVQLKTYKRLVKDSHRDFYTNIRQASLSAGPYTAKVPIEEQSCKVAALIDSIQPGELTVAFSFFVKRGVNFIRDALNACGWKEWNGAGDSDHPCFAVLDGKTPPDIAGAIINNFNSLLNIDGSEIQLLIGSSVMNESISLRNVRHVHILTPFWNYGQIHQAIGRTIRMRSHVDNTVVVNIYLHVSVIDHGNGELSGIDLDMYETAYNKEVSISKRLEFMTSESIWSEDNGQEQKSAGGAIPHPDNKFIFRIMDCVWDFRQCFDTNINRISWFNVYRDRALCYSKDGAAKIKDIPPAVEIPVPQQGKITAWMSVVDGRVRIADLRFAINRKKMKRGKLVNNMSASEIDTIAKHLGTSSSVTCIIEELEKRGCYIAHQIIVHDPTF